MRIDVLTLFPEMIEGLFSVSIIGKAREKGIVTLNAVNFRDYSESKHKTVDDTPYGGGGGMVLKPEPLFAAVEAVRASGKGAGRVILMSPQGERFQQEKAERLAREERLIFICGHYEGFDERIRLHLADEEISIGDFVLTGGEIPAMAVIDSVVRLLPGALGNETSARTDSFSSGLLEHPHYTRPPEFRGWQVPEVLLSGHHERIEEWRFKEAYRRTRERRPDLLEGKSWGKRELQWIRETNKQAMVPESK